MWSASTIYMILFAVVTVTAISFIGWVAYKVIKRDGVKKNKVKRNSVVKKNSIVTVVDNETGEEVRGRIVEYTPDSIVLIKYIQFDAKKVHFKEVK